MTNALSGPLSGRPLADAVAVPAAETCGRARTRAAGRWVVPTDPAGAPLAAVAPAVLAGQPGNRPLATVMHDLPPARLSRTRRRCGR
jgi:hypothetical protein